MSGQGWLLVGIVLQCGGLAALRASAGMSRRALAVGAYVGLVGSVLPVSLAIEAGIPLAVAYSLWTGAGIAFAAIGGVGFFGDRLSRRQVLGLALVLLGLIALQTG
ncbi:hypothetical protein KLP28_01405 [Nocardioidaceae bacterium]|nr:hypothetical protein KLP28_01405 [Nocardioidaceae bacterium]